MSDFLKCDEVREMLTKDDCDGVAKVTADDDKAVEESNVFRERVLQLRASAKAAAAKSGARGRQARNDIGQARPFVGRRYPRKVVIPASAWAEKDVAGLLPPECRILRDENNQRWLVTFFGERRSRSWGCHG